MTLTLRAVEQLAPDQASLNAASKLRRPSRWSQRGQNAEAGLLWAACQGSGANPYRVVADVQSLRTRCTCPSRKLPCKHALALLWIRAEGGGATFPEGPVPDWVGEWVARRRRGRARPPGGGGGEAKSLVSAEAQVEARPDPETEARRAEARRKREAATRAQLLDGLLDLDQWMADQLRLGLSGALAELSPRCRQIAARLMDAKAAALASRLDELPARVLGLPESDRGDALLAELGKLVLLVRAYRAAPTDPELHRAVATSESREALEALEDAPRLRSTFEVLGERITTRRDGLISHATWLLDVLAPEPRFAVLLDFHPASVGRQGPAFAAGEQLTGELRFYPARAPLRAILVERGDPPPSPLPWACAPASGEPLAGYAAALAVAPWTLSAPVLLPPGRLAEAPSERRLWWTGRGSAQALPLDERASAPALLATAWTAAVGLWDGHQLSPLAATTPLGRLHVP
ncbi:MAG: SWIM zinc finger family protein [Sandaracinaceae bacterium]